jgi:endoglucanase
MKGSHLGILRAMLSAPTAPFCEQAVVAAVSEWAGRLGLKMTRDGAGNVFLPYRRGRRRKNRWFFTAHMDHPGFLVLRTRGKTVWAQFRGSVGREYFAGSGVRFFPPGREVPARVIDAVPDKPPPWLLCRLEVQDGADVPPGTFGMWDLPALRISGRRLSTRACDDVVGSAAVVCAMEEIVSGGLEADVTGLLTRAEEGGFVGALAACEKRSVPRDAMIVSIEASQVQPQAQLGDGVVVRVGDKMRTFDATLTAHLAAVAEAVASRDGDFRFVRRLMPGGTCESMVFCIYGYTAAALCLPLDNYHNMGPGNRIAPEQVDVNDFESLVKLLVALAADGRHPREADEALKKRLRALYRERRKYL